MLGGYQIINLKTNIDYNENFNITNEEDKKQLKNVCITFVKNELKPILLRFHDNENGEDHCGNCSIHRSFNDENEVQFIIGYRGDQTELTILAIYYINEDELDSSSYTYHEI